LNSNGSNSKASVFCAFFAPLQDYPEGPGVLLELVQNADDAGATKAAFLLDMRQHATSSLLGPGMAAWQGPALLAYNNAIFSPGVLFRSASVKQWSCLSVWQVKQRLVGLEQLL
jgi:hypothetical protein